ncbi:MAG TPA: hypothetical protein VMM77_02820 [Gemmatimonadaceae bacterium]|nr:hypothetical protein [Gemmatimonadaceae bacterium]
MTRNTLAATEADPAMPALPRGALAQRALLLRRAANRTSRRILRSLGTVPHLVWPVAPEGTSKVFERIQAAPPSAPLGRPVEPDVALEEERNRWGGRL